MSEWEEIDDADSPFATTPHVDGIVYAKQDYSPELAMGSGTYAPPPPPLPVRPAPQRPQHTSTAPWNPAPQANQGASRRAPRGTNPVKVFILGIIPILIAAGLVYGVMHLYGNMFH